MMTIMESALAALILPVLNVWNERNTIRSKIIMAVRDSTRERELEGERERS